MEAVMQIDLKLWYIIIVPYVQPKSLIEQNIIFLYHNFYCLHIIKKWLPECKLLANISISLASHKDGYKKKYSNLFYRAGFPLNYYLKENLNNK